MAIGTGLADAELLEQCTGSKDRVIISDPRKLHDAFRRSEEVINRQMLASTGRHSNFKRNVTVTSSWAALIAIGAAIGLVIGQNRHLRRRMLAPKEVVLLTLGGIVTGLVAGAAGQSFFYFMMTSEVPAFTQIGRGIAWALMGCGVGFGMGSFVPNLNRKRAAVAGAVGGLAAATAFILLGPLTGDTVGRLLGAAILGLSTGMMMVLVEAALRSACVIVHWSERERSNLTLGPRPIIVGSTGEAHVLIPEDVCPKPVAARIRLVDGHVYMDDHEGETYVLDVGHVIEFGPTRVEICGEPGGGSSKKPRQTATEREQRLAKAAAR